MFKIIIIGHGELANGFLDASNMIIGEQDGVETVILSPGENFETYLSKLRQASDNHHDVLFLADLKGGTPANAATYLVKEKKYTCIAGINLPILLEILAMRMAGSDLNTCIRMAEELKYQSIHFITV